MILDNGVPRNSGVRVGNAGSVINRLAFAADSAARKGMGLGLDEDLREKRRKKRKQQVDAAREYGGTAENY